MNNEAVLNVGDLVAFQTSGPNERFGVVVSVDFPGKKHFLLAHVEAGGRFRVELSTYTSVREADVNEIEYTTAQQLLYCWTQWAARVIEMLRAKVAELETAE